MAPLQQAEAIDIRRKSDAFGEKVEEFRKFFQQKAPFAVPGGELKLEHVRHISDSSNINLHCYESVSNVPIQMALVCMLAPHLPTLSCY